ncbi:hypothetical protein PHYBLDRAFT_58492 [Phycomyces blakesleeanus NRRL 1555(-)]|uniref:Uncharacterized protein n=1 Tax=Phycomyces blakesleeanus (strain ATCC 8743b / DSM 1359 / FGSC 10004 / NBRC 33097 / NRRL 1555) TaxID=763407 RepID=A0A167QBX1_PHYB8|nr:hypothetical protein PHYBLDRAFT_58492 [Phycomyces blakesleeanus NRRL 1555(-)]OAD79447.1 hypothetical protein PHYBLDRAFT_58492 [Phycomyces blakesleeanus NRRL 1555(-)]|eukprot:XP_018297487.1 hypothetical protein PHYBLDRAFT_58492 [Phycomyces blakesleeanus NRRL 1555(-)]
MPEHEYNCLVEYYQVAYNDYNISSCKKAMTSPAFVNDRIEVLKSIVILGQVYKGCNGNGRELMHVMVMLVKFNTSLYTPSLHQQPLSYQLATTTSIPLLLSDSLKQHQIHEDNLKALKSTMTTSIN